MDLICAGMYRACSTWQYEVVASLVERYCGGQRLGYVEGSRYRPRSSGGAVRVLKCHDQHPRFGGAINRGAATAIYAYRDLRDVLDSMRHKTGKTFDGLMAEGLIHRILWNDSFWRKQPRVLVQRYEELVTNPVQGVIELAGALSLQISEAEASAIASEYSIAANRARSEQFKRQLSKIGVSTKNTKQQLRADPGTLLHVDHLREGAVGGWQRAFNSTQLAIIRELSGTWLMDNSYPIAEDRTTPRWGCIALIVPIARIRSMVHAVIYFATRRNSCISRCLSSLKNVFSQWENGIVAETGEMRPKRSSAFTKVRQ